MPDCDWLEVSSWPSMVCIVMAARREVELSSHQHIIPTPISQTRTKFMAAPLKCTFLGVLP